MRKKKDNSIAVVIVKSSTISLELLIPSNLSKNKNILYRNYVNDVELMIACVHRNFSLIPVVIFDLIVFVPLVLDKFGNIYCIAFDRIRKKNSIVFMSVACRMEFI